MRVVLVDDNELTRAGYAEILRTSPGIELVAAVGHADALAWTEEWAAVDVAIVDAADEGSERDQFPGVAVVRRARACQGRGRPTVVVVTGHFMNDGLRHRMHEAQADFFFLRADLRSADALRDVVLHPERHRRGVPPVTDPETPELLGVDGADLERLVSYVDDHGLHAALGGGEGRRAEPRSRAWLRHRRAMTEASGVRPRNVTTGNLPGESQRWASIRQLSRIYRWAARIPPLDDGTRRP